MIPGSNKPLSPHLSIYKPQVTSVLSIMHRITGAMMFVEIVISVWWIIITQLLSSNNDDVCSCGVLSYCIQAYLISFVFCLSYHLCAGVRYLFWTLGVGFNIDSVHKSAYAIVLCSFVLTIIVMTLFYY